MAAPRGPPLGSHPLKKRDPITHRTLTSAVWTTPPCSWGGGCLRASWGWATGLAASVVRVAEILPW